VSVPGTGRLRLGARGYRQLPRSSTTLYGKSVNATKEKKKIPDSPRRTASCLGVSDVSRIWNRYESRCRKRIKANGPHRFAAATAASPAFAPYYELQTEIRAPPTIRLTGHPAERERQLAIRPATK